MLVVGIKDREIDPEYQIAEFKALFPDGPIVKLPNSGYYSQENAPETLVTLIHQIHPDDLMDFW